MGFSIPVDILAPGNPIRIYFELAVYGMLPIPDGIEQWPLITYTTQCSTIDNIVPIEHISVFGISPSRLGQCPEIPATMFPPFYAPTALVGVEIRLTDVPIPAGATTLDILFQGVYPHTTFFIAKIDIETDASMRFHIINTPCNNTIFPPEPCVCAGCCDPRELTQISLYG
jgi:hypothetical protein